MMKDEFVCSGVLHPKAIEGLKLFNEQKFFEAHEELEDAWRKETGEIRDLYQGILQVAVAYLHITRGNYNGAIKVYGRSTKWLKDLPEICRGIQVGKLRNDAENVIQKLKSLGAGNIAQFDKSLFQPITWNEKRVWICDRCGTEMFEKNCKVTCPNCGNRFDCSDLNIYFD
jgi:predicted metal-dependent hydrolase